MVDNEIESEIESAALHPYGFKKDDQILFLSDLQGQSYIYNNKTKSIKEDSSFLSMSERVGNTIFQDEFKLQVLGNKKYSYTRMKVLGRNIPVVSIVGFDIGLKETLKRYNTKFKVIDKEAFRKFDKTNLDFIKFKNAVLLYQPSFKDLLLYNGLKELMTEEYNIEDFGKGGQGWIDYFIDSSDSSSLPKKVKNFIFGFLDPMSVEVLSDLGLPTDFSGVFLYCTSLLVGNDCRQPNDMSNYRIRGIELVNALLYKKLMTEVEKARRTEGSAESIKVNLPRTSLIKELQQARNVSELPDLNPLNEAELISQVTWIGSAGGIGDSRMVTQNMRSFHPSMKNIMGIYSPDSKTVGVNRALSYGATIATNRGYLNIKNKTDASGLTINELISPFTSRHSDPPRIGMQAKQAAHTMPIEKGSPLLVGSGAEKSLAYVIGDTFTPKALNDGIIKEIDEKNKLVKIVYKDGKKGLIDLNPRNNKNSGGGL
jgi:hypothetical protein